MVKSRSVKRNEKTARELGRDRAAEPVRISLTACSGISAPDIPSDWSIVTVNIITHFSRRHRPLSQVARVLFSLCSFNSSPLYYLRAWHRLGITSLASRTSLTSALTQFTCGKSTIPTTEPGLPGSRLAGLGMGGGKGSE